MSKLTIVLLTLVSFNAFATGESLFDAIGSFAMDVQIEYNKFKSDGDLKKGRDQQSATAYAVGEFVNSRLLGTNLMSDSCSAYFRKYTELYFISSEAIQEQQRLIIKKLDSNSRINKIAKDADHAMNQEVSDWMDCTSQRLNSEYGLYDEPSATLNVDLLEAKLKAILSE